MSENLPGSYAAINHPPTENVAAEPRQADPMHGKPSEVFQTFLKIGLTAFGGPIAHLGYFEREIIERRKWLTQNAYGDLVALCQFLPGPASSQVAFALGYLRAGIGGGVCCDCRLYGAFSGFDDRHRLRFRGHQGPVRIFTRTETCRSSGSCSGGVDYGSQTLP
jgi:hypothetical protein